MKDSDYKQASALKQKMRRHNDKINSPITINDLIVYPADPSINGEFNQPQQQSASQSQEDRIARMTAEIRRLADFAVANHTQTSAGDNVTRIATPEFFFYTNPPLSQEEYSTLIQNIETMAAQLPQDIHMILGSFHLEHTSGALLNSTIHVQTGPQPEINAFAKTTHSPVDPAASASLAFNQNPVKHLGQQASVELEEKQNKAVFSFTPKAFTASEDAGVVSNYPLIRCTTASGAEFTTAIDMCMDHSMAHARKMLMDALIAQDGLMPIQCSHVIISNSISKSDHAQITEGGIVHHVDAWPSEQNDTPLDARNLQRFQNSIPLNMPHSTTQSSKEGCYVESLAFGKGYNIKRYAPEQITRLSPEFLSSAQQHNKQCLKNKFAMHPSLAEALNTDPTMLDQPNPPKPAPRKGLELRKDGVSKLEQYCASRSKYEGSPVHRINALRKKVLGHPALPKISAAQRLIELLKNPHGCVQFTKAELQAITHKKSKLSELVKNIFGDNDLGGNPFGYGVLRAFTHNPNEGPQTKFNVSVSYNAQDKQLRFKCELARNVSTATPFAQQYLAGHSSPHADASAPSP